jgi:hypothetical protein
MSTHTIIFDMIDYTKILDEGTVWIGSIL